MQSELLRQWHVEATVFYDRPPDFFRPASLQVGAWTPCPWRLPASPGRNCTGWAGRCLGAPTSGAAPPGPVTWHPTPPCPGPAQEKHDLLVRLADELARPMHPRDFAAEMMRADAAANAGSGQATTLCTTFSGGSGPALRVDRPAVVVSSTSWTPDEDFGLLLAAAQAYDAKVCVCVCVWCEWVGGTARGRPGRRCVVEGHARGRQGGRARRCRRAAAGGWVKAMVSARTDSQGSLLGQRGQVWPEQAAERPRVRRRRGVLGGPTRACCSWSLERARSESSTRSACEAWTCRCARPPASLSQPLSCQGPLRRRRASVQRACRDRPPAPLPASSPASCLPCRAARRIPHAVAGSRGLPSAVGQRRPRRVAARL
jgi:hypothetical protein